MLAAIAELDCTSMLLHNKEHGAAVVNPGTDFIVIDSQARNAFQLAPAASWQSESPSGTPSNWSRVDELGLLLNDKRFEEVQRDAFMRRACNVQYKKKQAVVLLR